MRSKITYLSSRATLMYMISISDCYSIGIHDFAKQEASKLWFYAGVWICNAEKHANDGDRTRIYL